MNYILIEIFLNLNNLIYDKSDNIFKIKNKLRIAFNFKNGQYFLNISPYKKPEITLFTNDEIFLSIMKILIYYRKFIKESVLSNFFTHRAHAISSFNNEKFIKNLKLDDIIKQARLSDSRMESREKNTPKRKSKKYELENSNKCLVLWDIENVKLKNLQKIEQIIPKKADKVYCSSRGNHQQIGLTQEFKKILIQKHWTEIRTHKIADHALIKEFHIKKHLFKCLYLITADSDFEEIIKEAIKLKIKVVLINDYKIFVNAWFNKYKPIFV